MSKARRLELINEIEGKRNSYVLAYVVSDRPNSSGQIASDVVREIYNLILELRPFEKNILDLFLYSRGGDTHVPWQIVSMIRELFEEFNVIIPYRAHSAATMIAMGADKIIMGKKGELSPIDVTHTGPHNPKDPDTKERLPVSVEDVIGFFNLLESLGKVPEDKRIDAFVKAMDQIPALALGRIKRTLAQTSLAATRLLEFRKEPFEKEVNEKIITKLSSEISSHHHCISTSEAINEVGLTQIEQNDDLEPTIWELLTLYEEEMKIYEPFYPEDTMMQSDLDEETFPNHKLIYLETVKRTRVFKLDVKMKKIRRHPPNINYDPKINLPSIDIPQQFQINQQTLFAFIQQWVQANVPGIIRACFDEFKKGFPVIAYDRQALNKKWVDE